MTKIEQALEMAEDFEPSYCEVYGHVESLKILAKAYRESQAMLKMKQDDWLEICQEYDALEDRTKELGKEIVTKVMERDAYVTKTMSARIAALELSIQRATAVMLDGHTRDELKKALSNSKLADLFHALLEEHKEFQIILGRSCDNESLSPHNIAHKKVEALKKECGL